MKQWEHARLAVHREWEIMDGRLTGGWEWKCNCGGQQLTGLEAVDQIIDEWGAHGWELVSVTPLAASLSLGTNSDLLFLWFKRPLKQTGATQETSPDALLGDPPEG